MKKHTLVFMSAETPICIQAQGFYMAAALYPAVRFYAEL